MNNRFEVRLYLLPTCVTFGVWKGAGHSFSASRKWRKGRPPCRQDGLETREKIGRAYGKSCRAAPLSVLWRHCKRDLT